MADHSLHSHEVDDQIARLVRQIQVEEDSANLVALSEVLNRLLEAREDELASLRRAKSAQLNS